MKSDLHPLSEDTLLEAFRLIEAAPAHDATRWTAQLEERPDGLVIFRDEHGNVRMVMPRDVYEELLD